MADNQRVSSRSSSLDDPNTKLLYDNLERDLAQITGENENKVCNLCKKVVEIPLDNTFSINEVIDIELFIKTVRSVTAIDYSIQPNLCQTCYEVIRKHLEYKKKIAVLEKNQKNEVENFKKLVDDLSKKEEAFKRKCSVQVERLKPLEIEKHYLDTTQLLAELKEHRDKLKEGNKRLLEKDKENSEKEVKFNREINSLKDTIANYKEIDKKNRLKYSKLDESYKKIESKLKVSKKNIATETETKNISDKETETVTEPDKEKEIKDLQEENTKLIRKLAVADRLREKMNKNFAILNEKIKNSNEAPSSNVVTSSEEHVKETEKLKKEIDDFKITLSTIDLEKRESDKKCAEIKEDYDNMMGEHDKIKTQLNRLQDQNKELNYKIKEFENDIKTKDEHLIRETENVSKIKSELNELRNNLDRRADEKDLRITDLENKLKNSETSGKNHEDELKKIKLSLIDANNKISSLNSIQMNSSKNHLSEKKKLSEEIEKYKEEIKSHSERVKQSESSYESQLKSYQEKLDESQKEIEKSKEKIVSSEVKIAENVKTTEEKYKIKLEGEQKKYNETVDKKDQEIKQLKQQLSDFSDKMSNYDNLVAELKEKDQELEEHKTTLKVLSGIRNTPSPSLSIQSPSSLQKPHTTTTQKTSTPPLNNPVPVPSSSTPKIKTNIIPSSKQIQPSRVTPSSSSATSPIPDTSIDFPPPNQEKFKKMYQSCTQSMRMWLREIYNGLYAALTSSEFDKANPVNSVEMKETYNVLLENISTVPKCPCPKNLLSMTLNLVFITIFKGLPPGVTNELDDDIAVVASSTQPSPKPISSPQTMIHHHPSLLRGAQLPAAPSYNAAIRQQRQQSSTQVQNQLRNYQNYPQQQHIQMQLQQQQRQMQHQQSFRMPNNSSSNLMNYRMPNQNAYFNSPQLRQQLMQQQHQQIQQLQQPMNGGGNQMNYIQQQQNPSKRN